MQQRLLSKFRQSGQSLVEVVVAAAALSLGLMAIIAGLIVSLRNTSVASNQTLATQQNQAAIERFRQFQRELGWESFFEILDDKGSTTYCLQTLPEDITDFSNLAVGQCTPALSETGLIRQAQIVIGIDQIEMIATTTWKDGNVTRHATATHTFKQY